MGQFDGKAVWITGASSGIGREMALEFARRGADVAVSGRRKERLESVVAEIEALGRRGCVAVCDVTQEEDVERACEEVATAFGKIDVVVANAGFGVAGRIEKLTAEDWRRQFDTNVVGLTSTVRATLPHLRETKGRIGLVGSVMSMLTMQGNGAYSASKYAVRAIGQTLSLELMGSGVTCTTIHPGLVHSEINQVNNKGEFNPDAVDKRPQKVMWATDDAARVMVDALYKRKREYTFTGHGKIAAFLGRHTPGFVHFALSRSGGKKKKPS